MPTEALWAWREAGRVYDWPPKPRGAHEHTRNLASSIFRLTPPHINASVKIPPLEGTGSSSMLSGGRSIVLPDAPPTPPPPSIANSFPNALPSALHRRFHQHPPTPLCLRWNSFGNTFVPPSPNYSSCFTAAESETPDGKLHIALKPKQPAAETAATTVGRHSRNNGCAASALRRHDHDRRGCFGRRLRACAKYAHEIVAETYSHMHAPEPDQWSNIITNFGLASPPPRSPTTSPIMTFPKRQSQSPKPSSSNIRIVACLGGYGATRPKQPVTLRPKQPLRFGIVRL